MARKDFFSFALVLFPPSILWNRIQTSLFILVVYFTQMLTEFAVQTRPSYLK